MTEPIFAPDFPLQSDRLIYRGYEDADAAWLFPIRQSEELMRYVPFGDESQEELEAMFEKRKTMNRIVEPGDAIMCVMVEKETGSPVGEVMLRSHERPFTPQTGEVGFILHPDHHRKGYASEAAGRMLKLGFEEAGFHRIIGICDAENVASRATLSKIGMREEAHHRSASFIKGEWRDDNTFAILAEEWRAGQ